MTTLRAALNTSTRMSRFSALAVVPTVAAVGSLGLFAGVANAGGPAQTQVFPAAGATFPCSPGPSFTVTGGMINFSIHDSFDATGGEHVTGTVRPSGVTASSDTPGDTTVYRIVGDSWFGGSFSANQQTGVFTSTDHFQILAPNGARVGSVNDIVHVDRNGTVVSHNFGNFTSPAG